MKRITISLEEDNYNYLKQLNTDRSMARNLNDLLDALREAGATIRPAIVSTTLIDTKTTPEGTTIKTTVPTTKQRTLTPQEEALKEQKINLELDRIRKRRIKTIKEKMMNILGELVPYIDETSPNYDESIIDFVLKKYPTDEDIDRYVLGVKEEMDSYTEPEEELYEYQNYIEECEKKIKKTKEYEQIKDYCIHNDKTEELYQLLHYPSDVQCHNYDFVIKPALGTPPSYEYTQEELELLASYFTPQEETGG